MNFEFHPAANLFPLMQEEELQELSKDIQANGQRDPIVILEGKILDGRNRWKACKLAEVEPRIRPVTLLEIGGSPTQFVLSTNLHRRHLSPIQKASVAADALPLFAEEARLRQVAAGKAQGGDKKSEPAKSALLQSTTKPIPKEKPEQDNAKRAASQAAQATGAGQRATTSMIAVKRTAPDVFQAVKDGKIDKVTDAVRLSKLEPEKRASVLEKIDAGGKVKSVVAEVVRQERIDKIAEISTGNKPLEAPIRCPVILCDPPWKYEHVETESRAIENQYPTMELADICALPVSDISTDDAILFLWATSPKLEEAFQVLNAWGFTYRTCMVWDKLTIGMGYYARQQHELLLICTKGSIPTPAPENRPSSVYQEKKGKHSSKPEYFYTMIEGMYEGLEKLEMFCRSPRADADGFWQREGIDVSITLASSKQILIDEKVRFRNRLTGKIYDDIALEVWSDRERKLKGWLQKQLRADYIAYAIAPLGVCYLLPVLQLQQAWSRWGQEWLGFYRTIEAKNYGPGRSWITESVCMPAEHVFWAIEQCFKVSFKPYDLAS